VWADAKLAPKDTREVALVGETQGCRQHAQWHLIPLKCTNSVANARSAQKHAWRATEGKLELARERSAVHTHQLGESLNAKGLSKSRFNQFRRQQRERRSPEGVLGARTRLSSGFRDQPER